MGVIAENIRLFFWHAFDCFFGGSRCLLGCRFQWLSGPGLGPDLARFRGHVSASILGVRIWRSGVLLEPEMSQNREPKWFLKSGCLDLGYITKLH